MTDAIDNNSPADVVIVGAGIIGVACAHYLNRAGLKVTVIDQQTIGGACSHGNLGLVCPSDLLPLADSSALVDGIRSLFNPRAPFRVRLQARPALYRWMLQFVRRCRHSYVVRNGGHLGNLLESSIAEYRSLFAEDLAGEWHDEGILYVFQDQQGLDGYAATDRLLTDAFDLRAQRLEGAELAELEPALRRDVAGAYFHPRDAWLRPDTLLRKWPQQLRDSGVDFIEHCRLERVEKTAGGIAALHTSKGMLAAHHYVFATGAWSSQLARELACDIPVEPGKGYSLTTSRPTLAPRHPMLFPQHRVGVTPFDEGFRLGSMMEFVGYDDSIPDYRIQQLRDAAAPYLQEPVGEHSLERWYGWRPMTWDSLPIIGAVPDLTNATLATGHNMLGVSLAAVTGRLVSELLLGATPHLDIAPFSPNRF